MGLFKPAWQSKNPDKAAKAVEIIDNIDELRRIAINAVCKEARLAALGRISDQRELYSFANGYSRLRMEILQFITDEEILAEIFECAYYTDEYRLAALQKIHNQELIFDLVMKVIKAKEHADILDGIRNMLTDSVMLEQLDEALVDMQEQDSRADRQRQESFLREALAPNIPSEKEKRAVRGIRDEDLLIKYIESRGTHDTIALDQITNQDILRDIAAGRIESKIMHKALAKLDDDVDRLLSVSLNSLVCESALERVGKIIKSEEMHKMAATINGVMVGSDMQHFMRLLQHLDEENWASYFGENAICTMVKRPANEQSSPNPASGIAMSYEVLRAIYKAGYQKELIESYDGTEAVIECEFRYGPDDCVRETHKGVFKI